MTWAVKVLVIINVVAFLLSLVVPEVIDRLGLIPAAVLGSFAIWQPVTYMFLHDPRGFGHILINMLSLWMFGTELERMWGTRFFTKYYLVTGLGAAATTLVWSLSSLPGAESLYGTVTIGASGAIYGILLAYALYFPNRQLYLYFLFPVQVKYFVMIVGAIAFISSLGSGGSGVAHTAHLGGLVVGYVYLRGLRTRPLDELRYRWMRWKMQRARGRFDVYSGGARGRGPDDEWKKEWKKHIH